MKKVEKVGEYYITKSKFWGNKIVYPVKNEDGSWNKFNLFTGGAWGKLLITLLAILLILGMCLSYYRDVKELRDFQKNICDYLPKINSHCLFKETKSTGYFPSDILILNET